MKLQLEALDHFSVPGNEEWEKQILKDLQLESLNPLKHPTDWGYHQEVFYRTSPSSQILAFPERFSFLSYIPSDRNAENIRDSIHHVLKLGSPGLWIELFQLPSPLTDLLKDVQEDILSIFFYLSNDAWDQIKKNYPGVLKKYSSQILLDPIALALRYGEWHESREKDFLCYRDGLPLFVDATVYKESGGSVLQELIYALLHTHELLLAVPDENKDCSIHVRFSQGISLFEEIAKIRAFRRLIPAMESLFELKAKWYIHATHSLLYSTPEDPYNHLIRMTTQAISGILGTCDFFIPLPWDQGFRSRNASSVTLSVQMMHTLMEEAFLHRVRDTLAGSFFVETLTEELVHRSWEGFLERYDRGIIALMEQGMIQQEIKAQRNKTISDYKEGKKKLVGATHYPAPQWMEKLPFPRPEKYEGKNFPALNPVRWYEYLRESK